MSNSLLSYFEDHLLPHYDRGREKPSSSRAKLINYSALSTYILFLAVIILILNILTLRLPGILGFASNINVGDIVSMTNEMRRANGLSTLSLDDSLSQAAQRKAEDMFTKDYWAHNSPEGTEPWYFITSSGYNYLYAGENLARDFQNSRGVVDAWMASPTHRDNLLNSHYQDIGVAVVNGTLGGFETTLVVQMFGAKSQLAAVPPAVAGQVPAVAEVIPVSEEVSVTSPPETAVEEEPIPAPPAAVPSPEPVIEPTPVPEITPPAEEPILELPAPKNRPTYLTAAQEAVSIPAFDVFSFSRTLSLILGGFALLLFTMDGFIMFRHHNRRLTGHTLAHIGLLLVAILGIWYVNVGAIL